VVFFFFVLHVYYLGLSVHFVLATPQVHELHLDLQEKQDQVLLREAHTPQRPELYMYVSTLERPVLLLEVYTTAQLMTDPKQDPDQEPKSEPKRH
jgi:hypothetical protein